MTQSTARPGRYGLEDNTLVQSQGSSGPTGPQQVTVKAPTAEVHYGNPAILDGTTSAQLGPVQLDPPNSSTLPNRIAMEFYNNGSNDVEVSTNNSFTFGKNQARTIKPGLSWSVDIGPANVSGGVKHYALCGAGNTCSLEITEVGQ